MHRLPREQYFVADMRVIGLRSRPHTLVCVEAPQPMPAPGALRIADLWGFASWVVGASGKVQCFPLAG